MAVVFFLLLDFRSQKANVVEIEKKIDAQLPSKGFSYLRLVSTPDLPWQRVLSHFPQLCYNSFPSCRNSSQPFLLVVHFLPQNTGDVTISSSEASLSNEERAPTDATLSADSSTRASQVQAGVVQFKNILCTFGSDARGLVRMRAAKIIFKV